MKMPRSHCETENVQFVQELAEVDGPFESPININFKDLTKLELPSLVWNRSDACPKKMKIANTGHTVIVSGKWKCERPYLTGGPLLGNYVFSQIHFHWGQDDCKGSEHLVCGEGFPLEMHVAHFKSDYLNQENALREKDGMVVLVYLFKIQEEPNTSLKKILNILPNIKEAGSSQLLDPRPILCLCNPFTDDYFMYWGSVVTSTCAHILMWLVCREPFGISKEQVNEFRKILDSSQQPICRNNRDTQPLHKRNVFHVNASKNLDCPMLAVKKIVGCFCGRGGEDNESSASRKDCCCQGSVKNQEDIEGNYVESMAGSQHLLYEGTRSSCGNVRQPRDFNVHQSLFVQRATVHSAPILPKVFENSYFGQVWPNSNNNNNNNKQIVPGEHSKLVSKSCCFIPLKELKDKPKPRPEKKRKKQKSFNSMRALSNIMASLEALKNQTFKKLKEIDSINQEIKGMKTFCQKTNDQKWLRRIEKIMTRQKKFTIKSSQSCLTELKKLAKECNIDQFFEGRLLSLGEKNKLKRMRKIRTDRALPYAPEAGTVAIPDKSDSKTLTVGKAIKFSNKAQKLIQSFFEDIQESEEFQKSLKNDLNLKRETLSFRSENSSSALSLGKGYITKKMFTLGNLGDRFFTEVTTADDLEGEEEAEDEVAKAGGEQEESYLQEKPKKKDTFFVCPDGIRKTSENGNEITEDDLIGMETVKEIRMPTSNVNAEGTFPLHRVNVAVGVSDNQEAERHLTKEGVNLNGNQLVSLYDETTNSSSSCTISYTKLKSNRSYMIKSTDDSLTNRMDSPEKTPVKNDSDQAFGVVQNSSSNGSSDSAETQRMIIAKFHRKPSRKDVREQRSSLTIDKVSSKGLCSKPSKKRHKFRNVNFEGYYIKKKNVRGKKKKFQKQKSVKKTESSCDMSSISKEDLRWIKSKYKWKHMKKTKFKLKIEKTSDSTIESAIEYSLVSPTGEKITLKSEKLSGRSGECEDVFDSTATIKFPSSRRDKPDDHAKEHPKPRPTSAREEIEVEKPTALKERMTDSFEKNEKIQTGIRYSRPPSRRETSRRSVSASSRDSKGNGPDNAETIEHLPNESFPRELEPTKNISINRSFTKISSQLNPNVLETCKRIFDQCHSENRERDVLELKRKLEISRRYGTIQPKSINSVNKGASLESYQAKEKLKLESQYVQQDRRIQNLQEFEIGFLATQPKQFYNENLIRTIQLEQGGTGITPKGTARCDIEKYHFLEKELQEAKTVSQIESVAGEESKTHQEIRKSDSDKSIESAGPDMKGDAAISSPGAEGKEIRPTIKKKGNSRPHSVESLTTSLTKRLKRKHKKRPHCCKRISRHYMRKTSCVFKRPKKVDSKPINFLNLSNEEQLKIISANVAKYLKQKLVEQKRNSDLEKGSEVKEVGKSEKQSTEKILKLEGENEEARKLNEEGVKAQKSEKEMEQPVIENPEKREENPLNLPPEKPQNSPPEDDEEEKRGEISEFLQGPPEKICSTEKFEEDNSIGDEGKEKSFDGPPKENEKKSTSTKPPLNFIKLNKQLAGKYKKSAKEGKTKIPVPQVKKIQEESKVLEVKKGKRGQTSLVKDLDQAKPDQQNRKVPAKKTVEKQPKKEGALKGGTTKKKTETPEKSKEVKPPTPPKKKKAESNESLESSSMALEKLPPKSSSSLVPAYMMSSLLSADIIENQQQQQQQQEQQQEQINKFLVNVKKKSIDTYLPEVLYEKAKFYDSKSEQSEAVFAKDLENLIKLQMCLNNEIAANIENSMNYIKTLLSQDYAGSAIVEKAPDSVDCFGRSQNGLVLIEMDDIMDCSSSSSDYWEETEMSNYLDAVKTKTKIESDSGEMVTQTDKSVPKESGDSKVFSSAFAEDSEGDEEYNSDSSYNCEISITLNGSSNQVDDPSRQQTAGSYSKEQFNNWTHLLRRESSLSQMTTTHADGTHGAGSSSHSIVLKPLRKKRKENEISIEMKKKLLEILEGEIRREMSLNYTGSSENSSDALPLKWDEPSPTQASQSAESGSDNTEVLTQISETMRQYLSEYKNRRLLKKSGDPPEKSKTEDES